MNVQIALSLLLSVTAVSARSLQGYNCREYPVFSGDPSARLRTVRVCGAMDYEAAPKYFQMRLRTEDAPLRSFPTNTLYSGDSVWPSPAFQHSSKRWPFSSQSYNYKEQPSLFRDQPIPQSAYAYETFNQIGTASNNPSTNNNELHSRNLMEVERSLKQQLGSLVEDVSEVKDSIANLVPYVKDIVDTLRMQSSHGKSEKSVNVNFKLDPSIEALVHQFLQLIDSTTEKNGEQITPEIIEDTNGRQEEEEKEEEEEEKTEASSEENTTQVLDSTAESSIEEDATEESEEDSAIGGENSLENLENWLRLSFGPSKKLPSSDDEIEEILNKTSEEENSAEKSDESFETWFNTVYRRVSTEPNYNHNSEENTQSSHESKEVVQSEINDNSEEDYWGNEKENEDETSKSSEASNESSENIDYSDGNENYEAYFVPTTTDTIQDDTRAEYLENGNKYDYATESNSIAKYEKCIAEALANINFGRRNYFSIFECAETLNEGNKSKDSGETQTAADSGSSESKESVETEPAVTDFKESKESGETESSTSDSNQLKANVESNYYDASWPYEAEY